MVRINSTTEANAFFLVGIIKFNPFAHQLSILLGVGMSVPQIYASAKPARH
jgi:hypothetical protein